MTAAEETPNPYSIPLAYVRRLGLMPGDQLAVIAPDWVDNEEKLVQFAALVRHQLSGFTDVQVAIFPPGTDLVVVGEQRKPRRVEYPVGGMAVAPAGARPYVGHDHGWFDDCTDECPKDRG